MAVFTKIDTALANDILSNYNLGELSNLTGISAGIENSNYFLDTTDGRYVLTVFEVLKQDQIPYYLELMAHLAEHGQPVPAPQKRNDGTLFGMLGDKPVSIVTRLKGSFAPDPTARHCELAAYTQANLQLAAQNYRNHQSNLRGLEWQRRTFPDFKPYLTPEELAEYEEVLATQIRIQATTEWQSLPGGPSHCDLFRDNVLFDKTPDGIQMGGVIDFYFAGNDKWIFDLAVALNDWCINRETGELVPELAQAWMRSYESVRPLSTSEKQLMPQALQAAALRFWTSRLYDYHLPREALDLKPHDPDHFRRIMHQRSKNLGNVDAALGF